LGIVAHTCYPSTQEGEAARLQVQTSQGYIARSCQKKGREGEGKEGREEAKKEGRKNKTKTLLDFMFQ
jgi:hypothetical protein